MPKIQPWTHSKLDDFVNCPRAFHAKSVLKLYPYVEGEAQALGNYVHKVFELYVIDPGSNPLPTKTKYDDKGKIISINLIGHKPYLDALVNAPGEIYAEREIAIDKKGKPCSWFFPDVWHRGKIDYTNINGARAKIVDYKTGKKREKFKQLIANSMWVFIQYPEVDIIDVCFYWTVDQSESKATYYRKDIDKLWDQLIPDLIQYRDAFKQDIWQPRQSGLCRGWCPVEDCEFWSPKRA